MHRRSRADRVGSQALLFAPQARARYWTVPSGHATHGQSPLCTTHTRCPIPGLNLERVPITSGEGMRRSEEARVSEEAVRRKGGGGGPRDGGWAKDGEAEEPA